jgi:hypothetical protein
VANYISPMLDSDRKELFSLAFVRAVASAAGFAVSQPESDRESVDLKISGDCTSVDLGPRLEVQVKCTSRDVFGADCLHFPLKIKNYHDLRTEMVLVPRILVVVCVPKEIESWVTATEFKTILKHSGYWISLRGLPRTENNESVTVSIPRDNRFTPNALVKVMGQISRREKL